MRPEVKRGNWTPEEDKLIFRLYHEHGSKWTVIAQFLDGRTENSIKNRFYSTLRKYTQKEKPEERLPEPVRDETAIPIPETVDSADDRMFLLLQQVNQLEAMLQATRTELVSLEKVFEDDEERSKNMIN